MLTTSTPMQIRLKFIHPFMNLLVLSQQLRGISTSFELRHFLREDREDVLFFDRMMRAEVGAELQSGRDKLF